MLAVQEWATQCHGADTGLIAQRHTVAGMGSLQGQHQGVIPRCARVVVRPCGVRALNARTHGREQVRAGALERSGHRSRGRQPSSEADLARGGVSPRARRTLLEGAFRCVTLVGRGGHQGDNRVVCVC
jgi:hypothetical protein